MSDNINGALALDRAAMDREDNKLENLNHVEISFSSDKDPIVFKKISYPKGTEQVEGYWCGEDDSGSESVSNFIVNSGRKMVASITTTDEICSINTLPDESYTSECIDVTELNEEEPPNINDFSNNIFEGNRFLRASNATMNIENNETNRIYKPNKLRGVRLNKEHGIFDDERNMQQEDSGSRIDVMVVFTKMAMCKEASQRSSCPSTVSNQGPIRSRIDLAVQETNTAYSLSGINTHLRLVHAYLDESYNDVGVSEKSLDNLTFQNDGKLDSVHQKRDQYGADIVVLITGSDSGGAGIGWIGPKSTMAFSVVKRTAMTGYFTFGHEIGHNMVCQI